MNKLVAEYVKYLASVNEITRPTMPKYNLSAYTESEYQNALLGIEKDFAMVDDFLVSVEFLKGL